MAALSVVPETVDLAAYAGDTITVRVTAVDPSLVEGLAWAAQVRSEADDVQADFSITPPGPGGSTAYLTLTGAQTEAMVAAAATRVSQVSGKAIARAKFTGAWDVQVSAAGADPIRTLARGKFTVDLDVTRVTP